MPPRYTIIKRCKHLCTMRFVLSLLAFVSIIFFTLVLLSSISNSAAPVLRNALNVYVADLPRSLNYGLLDEYWSSSAPDARISSDPDHTRSHILHFKFPPYPENPLIKQYSAEYWMTGDLMTPEKLRGRSFAKRVFDPIEADVVFVPFFSSLSAEMELMRGKSTFRKKPGNEDYARQKQVVEIVKRSDAWMRSGGRDHVFVLTSFVKN